MFQKFVLSALLKGTQLYTRYSQKFFFLYRIVGTAHVEDFNGRELAEVDALGAGIRLLRAIDRIDTPDRLMLIALMLV